MSNGKWVDHPLMSVMRLGDDGYVLWVMEFTPGRWRGRAVGHAMDGIWPSRENAKAAAEAEGRRRIAGLVEALGIISEPHPIFSGQIRALLDDADGWVITISLDVDDFAEAEAWMDFIGDKVLERDAGFSGLVSMCKEAASDE